MKTGTQPARVCSEELSSFDRLVGVLDLLVLNYKIINISFVPGCVVIGAGWEMYRGFLLGLCPFILARECIKNLWPSVPQPVVKPWKTIHEGVSQPVSCFGLILISKSQDNLVYSW